MRERLALLSMAVRASAFAVAAWGCDDAGAGPPAMDSGQSGSGSPSVAGVAGSGGSSVGGSSTGAGGLPSATALTWSAEGFVDMETNRFGLEGPFYPYSDCEPPSGLPCTTPDASLVGPDSKPGWLVDGARVCIKGTAVQVQDKMFSAQWGAGLALDLASPAGSPVKGAFDLHAAKIRGFSIDITGTAPGRIRINLTMPGVTDASFVDAAVPGTTTFLLDAAKQGGWVVAKTPLDPTRVEAIQFQVFTKAEAATPYDFCVSALRVLTDDYGGAP